MKSSGTWWIKSASDPRWNVSGQSSVGMFDQPQESKAAVARLTAPLGEPPADLEWGYMKD